jgi:hypothetical protein
MKQYYYSNIFQMNKRKRLFKAGILFINNIFPNFNIKYNAKNLISWLIMNILILWEHIINSIIKKQVNSATFFQEKK